MEHTKKIIRLLVVDDHLLMREGLRALLNTEPEMEMIGEAEDGTKAIELAERLHPDIILLSHDDIIPFIEEIKAANLPARILILTNSSEDETVFTAIKSGALGYLLQDCSSQELIRAIKGVYNGHSFLHPIIARKVLNEFNSSNSQKRTLTSYQEILTEREIAVLSLIAKGLSNHRIAEELLLSDRTIHVHVRKILEKLHLSNRTQAALYAVRYGIVKLEKNNSCNY